MGEGGGVCTNVWVGGVNMWEAQIYIKNIKNRKKYCYGGGCRLSTGGYFLPHLGGCKIITAFRAYKLAYLQLTRSALRLLACMMLYPVILMTGCSLLYVER